MTEVRHFRQIVLWPLQLMPLRDDVQIQRHVDLLARPDGTTPWHELLDEFDCDPHDFQERHYAEFVNFLPSVQRVLYGEGHDAGDTPRPASIRVFRRDDVQGMRVTLHPDGAPVDLRIAHVDLYFFFDIDVVIPVVEFFAERLPLATVQELLYRVGRAYPPYWEEDGHAGHCPWRVEWLARDGAVLAASDYERRDKYLEFVGRHRSPGLAAHWEWLLAPMVQHHSSDPGPVRFRQIEYHRMPTMAWLAFDDVDVLTRADWVRLGMMTGAGDPTLLPFSQRHLQDFEPRYCIDRFFEPECGARWMNTRMICTGPGFAMVGRAGEAAYTDRERGLLAQFRHQYFVVFMLSHFQKAALLMLSDRLVVALSRLDIQDIETIRRFKRNIRQMLEIFLRFTHRYWFHEISNQVQVQDVYRMLSGHLGTDPLYVEVRDAVKDMNAYLEGDTFRRQANTVVRLTVVTIFGLVGSVLTGLFGMNLFDFSAIPLKLQLVLFPLVGLVVATLLLYTIAKAKPLGDFLDAVSDERLPLKAKVGALLAVWRRPQR